MNAVHRDRLIGLLWTRGKHGIVPSDMPKGVSIGQAEKRLRAHGVDLMATERVGLDETVPALRLVEPAERARIEARERPTTRVEADVCLWCRKGSPLVGQPEADPCPECVDGHTRLEAIVVHGLQERYEPSSREAA